MRRYAAAVDTTHLLDGPRELKQEPALKRLTETVLALAARAVPELIRDARAHRIIITVETESEQHTQG